MKRIPVLLGAIALTSIVSACDRAAQPAAEAAQASQAAASPATELVKSTRFGYDVFKGYITKAADQVSEGDYKFKPAGTVAEVRTLGQLFGHLVDANVGLCAAASGAESPATLKDVEKTLTTKADLTKALGEAFAFCDQAWAGTTDANAATSAEMPFGLGKSTRLAILAFNSSHNGEHYGNIVTYMRAKGLVPPSSAPAGRGGGGE